jgi:nucleoside-diphosphate-sugar epimerase
MNERSVIKEEGMYTVLVTGAFGNVGQSVIKALFDKETWNLRGIPEQVRAELLDGALRVRVLEMPGAKNHRVARSFSKKPGLEIMWESLTDETALTKALEGVDRVIHLAAIIPPLSNAMPDLAYKVNVEGTKLLIRLMEAMERRPRLVFSSSVAVYGDRVENYFIRADDKLCPCEDDSYARHKVACEDAIHHSELEWVVCRLSYIVWRKKLFMDPLMFRMPPETHLEVCHTLDTGLALVRAAFVDEALGKTLNLGGGGSCRTTYREYLDAMFRMFGLGGSDFLPRNAFSATGFHCGYMDTDEANRLLDFQKHDLAFYYREVREETRYRRFWIGLARKAAQAWLIAQSPFLKHQTGMR